MAGDHVDEEWGTAQSETEHLRSLLRSLTDRAGKLETLAKLTGFFNTSLNLEHVVKKAVEATVALVNCEAGALMLRDGNGYLCLDVTVDRETREMTVLPLQSETGVAGWVMSRGEPLLLNDALDDPRVVAGVHGVSGIPVKNLICIPLRVKDEAIGVLQGVNKKTGVFSAEDLDLAQLLGDQIAMALDHARLYEELKGMTVQVLQALSEAIDKRDSYTGGHTRRVLKVALAISRHLPMTTDEKDRLMWASILHDVGKVGITDSILNKTQKLSTEEFDTIMQHPIFGAEILNHIGQLAPIIPSIMSHHERYDGSGYPRGLKGEAIPLLARVIAVADSFDAMITDRPYQEGLSREEAVEEIRQNRGVKFDPEVADAFLIAVAQDEI